MNWLKIGWKIDRPHPFSIITPRYDSIAVEHIISLLIFRIVKIVLKNTQSISIIVNNGLFSSPSCFFDDDDFWFGWPTSPHLSNLPSSAKSNPSSTFSWYQITATTSHTNRPIGSSMIPIMGQKERILTILNKSINPNFHSFLHSQWGSTRLMNVVIHLTQCVIKYGYRDVPKTYRTGLKMDRKLQCRLKMVDFEFEFCHRNRNNSVLKPVTSNLSRLTISTPTLLIQLPRNFQIHLIVAAQDRVTPNTDPTNHLSPPNPV